MMPKVPPSNPCAAIALQTILKHYFPGSDKMDLRGPDVPVTDADLGKLLEVAEELVSGGPSNRAIPVLTEILSISKEYGLQNQTRALQKYYSTLKQKMMENQWQGDIQAGVDAAVAAGKKPNFLKIIDKQIQKAVVMFEAAKDEIQSAFFTPLRRNRKLKAVWNDDNHIKDIIRGLYDPEHKSTVKEVQEIVKKLRQFILIAAGSLTEKGVYTEARPTLLWGRSVAHPYKVGQYGQEQFIALMERMYRDGGLDRKAFLGMNKDARAEKFAKIFQTLAHEQPADKDRSIKFATDWSHRLSQEDDIPFATADAFFEFFDLFSDVSLQEAALHRVSHMGRGAGVMASFGIIPEQTVDLLVEKFQSQMTASEYAFLTKLREVRELDSGSAGLFEFAQGLTTAVKERLAYANPYTLIRHLNGDLDRVASEPIAQFTFAAKALSAAADLHSIIFSQIPDLVIKAAMLSRAFGGNVFSNLLRPLEMVQFIMPPEQTARFLEQFAAWTDAAHKLIYYEFGGLGVTPNGLGRMVDAVFTFNIAKMWDSVNKKHTLFVYCKGVADMLDNLPEYRSLEKLLADFDIKDADFSALRRAVIELEGGIKVVDPSLLERDLHVKFKAFLYDQVVNHTPTPTMREVSMLLGDSQAGTVGRFGWTMFGMYKSFPLSLTSRIYPRIGAEAGTTGILSTMVTMAAFWYLADSAKQMAAGKTPMPLDRPENWERLLVASGIGGLYADVLLRDYHITGQTVADFIGGPMVRHAQDFLAPTASYAEAVRNQIFGGDPAEFPVVAYTKAVRNILPATFYTRTALDRLIFYGILEGQEPGYVDRMYKRIKEQTGQERLF